MVRTGFFVRACTEFASDSGSRHREMKLVLLRRPNVRLTCAASGFDKWQHVMAQNTHEKRTRFRVAPAASGAGRVGPWAWRCAMSGVRLILLLACAETVEYAAQYPRQCLEWPSYLDHSYRHVMHRQGQ